MPAESSFCRVPKWSTSRSTTARGQPRDLGEQPVAARGDRAVEVLGAAEAQGPGHGGRVDELGRRRAPRAGEQRLRRLGAAARRAGSRG